MIWKRPDQPLVLIQKTERGYEVLRECPWAGFKWTIQQGSFCIVCPHYWVKPQGDFSAVVVVKQRIGSYNTRQTTYVGTSCKLTRMGMQEFMQVQAKCRDYEATRRQQLLWIG